MTPPKKIDLGKGLFTYFQSGCLVLISDNESRPGLVVLDPKQIASLAAHLLQWVTEPLLAEEAIPAKPGHRSRKKGGKP